jgi:hypothetical protein
LGFQRTLNANVFGKMNEVTGYKEHFLFSGTTDQLSISIQSERLLRKALPLVNGHTRAGMNRTAYKADR